MTTAIESKYTRYRRRHWGTEKWTESIARVTAWNEANPERTRFAGWARNLRTRYGMTVAQYDEMLAAQGGTCAVCRRPESVTTAAGTPKRLAVDHDHATGRVRGLLCVACNHALGRLGDDLVRLRSLVAYLEAQR